VAEARAHQAETRAGAAEIARDAERARVDAMQVQLAETDKVKEAERSRAHDLANQVLV
jgi:hypothetical protein